MTEAWQVKLTGPARRALERDFPHAVAWAAYAFITERLPFNPYRRGGELTGPYVGCRSAHLGTIASATGSTRQPRRSSS